jgi:hypothetical protein
VLDGVGVRIVLRGTPTMLRPTLLSLTMLAGLGACSSVPLPDPIDVALISVEAQHARARQIIPDPERSARASAAFEDADTAIRLLAAARYVHRDRLRVLNADYDAPREAFTAEFERYSAHGADLLSQLLAARTELARHVTPDEWHELVTEEINEARKAFPEF